jgi:hypothetical protein
MKRIILLGLLIGAFNISLAQSTTPGYYVNQSNDTINVQIKIPKSFLGVVQLSKFIDEFEVIDSSKAIQTFTPEDVKSFGFYYGGVKYNYYSKPIKNGKLKFLQPVVIGSKSSIYEYSTVTYGSYGMSFLHVYYTFEKQDGTNLFVTNSISINKLKDQIKAYYQDYVAAQQIIEEKFQKRSEMFNDMKEVVKAVNKF